MSELPAAPAPFLRVVSQRHIADCTVACLAMVLGQSYEAVLLAFKHNVIAKGAKLRQIQAVARAFGRSLRWSHRVDLEQDFGMLLLESPDWKDEHAVVLKGEMVIDTDNTIWDADVYLAAYHASAVGILKLVKA